MNMPDHAPISPAFFSGWRRAVLAIAIVGGGWVRAQKAYFPIMIDQPMEYSLQTAFCREVPEPPIMDGRLDDPCWKEAERLADFQLTDKRLEKIRETNPAAAAARHQTHCKVVRSENTLYIAFECLEPEMDKIRAEAVYHDEERILFDDRICVYIDPNHDHQNLYQFIVNPRGATLERPIARPIPYASTSILGPIEWNTEWFARVRRLEDRWTGEIAITLDRLRQGAIQPGDTIGFNICRDRRPIWRFGPHLHEGFTYPEECSAWTYVRTHSTNSMEAGHWFEPVLFGDLVFDARNVEVTKLSFYQSKANYNGDNWRRPQRWGDNPLDITMRNVGEQPRRVQVEVTTKEPGNEQARTIEAVLAPTAVQTSRVPIPVRGHDEQPFTIRVSDAVDGRQLYRATYSTRVPPFVEFDLSSVYAPAGKTAGVIQFAPIVMPDAVKGLTLQMSLARTGETNVHAARTIAALDPSAGFAEAFPGFDVATLPPGSYEIRCTLSEPGGKVAGRFEQPFTRPSSTRQQELGARDGRYDFAGQTGRAVVVSFPRAEDYVFWERSSYVPWWDVSGVGVCYEFVECWGYGNTGCSEPMQDKENRFSRVRIVENSPARVVVHWRYALSDPNYRIFRDEWVDEYYYFYPDAVGVRQVNLWANSDIRHEFLQPQYVMPPGVLPGQVFEREPCRVFNLAGDAVVDDLDLPGGKKPKTIDCDKWPEGVMRIRLKDRRHPFYAWVRRDDIFPRIEVLFPPWQPPYGALRYNLGAHWPIKSQNVDIYNIISTHQAYHTWSGMILAKSDSDHVPNTWVHLIGITDRDDDFLGGIAASWGYPAHVLVEGQGWRSMGYDFKQRAFLLEGNNVAAGQSCQVRLKEAKRSQVFNPVFVLKGAPGPVERILCNGAELSPASYRWAPSHRTDEMVIWLGQTLPDDARVEIRFGAKETKSPAR